MKSEKQMYRRNRWLMYIVQSTKGMTLSAALLVPFFLENDLSQTEIMLLQAIFSAAVIAFEFPTGFVADAYGRAVSLKVGSLAIAIGMVGYAFAYGFGQFVVMELLLGIGFALVSGADDALVYDSMVADGVKKQFRKYSANLQSVMFGMVMIGAPIGSLIAVRTDIRHVLFFDGVLSIIGLLASLWLKEPPLNSAEEPERHIIKSIRVVGSFIRHGHPQLLWLMLLGALLGTITYVAFWMAPVYYSWVGIPLVWFGTILAVRSGLKALLSLMHNRLENHVSDRQQLTAYVVLSIAPYILLAALKMPAAIVLLAAFDAVQALHLPLVKEKMQHLTPSHIRAQVGSVFSLLRRALYAVFGVAIAWGFDQSVRTGLIMAATLFLPPLVYTLIRTLQYEGAENT